MKHLTGLLILAGAIGFPICVEAYPVVGYVCDTKQDRIEITYRLLDDDKFESWQHNKPPGSLDPWSLIIPDKDGYRIESLKTVRWICSLSDGIYEIEISASPGNPNVGGTCGAWITAGAKVSRARRVLYERERFEAGCHLQEPVVTKVTIKAGNPAAETVVPWEAAWE